MQTCYNCGKQVDDNVLICPDCGALVKRYGKPEPIRQEEFVTEDAPAQQPNAPIYVGANGKLRFRTGIRVWLILCCIAAGYMVFSFGCLLFAYSERDFFLATLSAYSELSAYVEILTETFAIIEQYLWLYLLIPILYAAKFALLVSFLITKKRGVFVALELLSFALMVFLFAVSTNAFSAILSYADVFIAGIFLRSWLRKPPQDNQTEE